MQVKTLTAEYGVEAYLLRQYLFCVKLIAAVSNKPAKSSKFLSPQRAAAYYGILALREQILLKRGTHVASYGVFREE